MDGARSGCTALTGLGSAAETIKFDVESTIIRTAVAGGHRVRSYRASGYGELGTKSTASCCPRSIWALVILEATASRIREKFSRFAAGACAAARLSHL